jgi:hypothetical protein
MSTVTIHRRIQEYEVVRGGKFEPALFSRVCGSNGAHHYHDVQLVLPASAYHLDKTRRMKSFHLWEKTRVSLLASHKYNNSQCKSLEQRLAKATS